MLLTPLPAMRAYAKLMGETSALLFNASKFKAAMEAVELTYSRYAMAREEY
jgi:hypothetical protein